jgi:hypothetical protein
MSKVIFPSSTILERIEELKGQLIRSGCAGPPLGRSTGVMDTIATCEIYGAICFLSLGWQYPFNTLERVDWKFGQVIL